MDEQVVVAAPSVSEDQQASAADGSADEMVQYVIYSGEGDQPIGLDELRDALTKLTGQPVNLQEGAKGAQPALGQDTDVGFRLNAERMVGEVSFVDESIIDNKQLSGQKQLSKASLPSTKTVSDASQVGELLKRQVQIPSQITIETEYGPITLDTSKLTPGQLDGTEQITVNLLTTDPSGDTSKEVTETRGLKLPPGLLVPKGKSGLGDGMVDDASVQGADFNSVLQQLTDLCSEQNPLPVQDTEKILKDTDGLDEFMNLKIPQKQSNVIEMDRLESYLKSKFGDTAKIQVQQRGVVVDPSRLHSAVKPTVCCAAHSELKNQETRRRMLPIPLDVTKCPECQRQCHNRKNLRLHIQRFHVQDFKHQCQTRARVIPPPPEDIITDIPVLVDSTESLAAIGEKSAPKTYKCSICEQHMNTQKEYFSHIECHGQHNLFCVLCGMKYSKCNQLKNHVNVVHGREQLLRCKHCMQTFSSVLEWTAHSILHETPNEGVIQCLKCPSLVPQAKFRHHMASLHRVVNKSQLDCVFCGSHFKTPEFLAAHVHKFHNFEKNINLCALCYKAFPSPEERDGHILRMHKDEEILDADVEFSWEPRDCYKRQCARCGDMFPNYAKLKAHYDKHGVEKNACMLCAAEFHWIVNLDLHYTREHLATDIVKFGIHTPTMNLLRFEDGSFGLEPKLGRQFCSRFDIADLDPVEEMSAGQEIVALEYAAPTQSVPPPSPPRHVIQPKDVAPKVPKILTSNRRVFRAQSQKTTDGSVVRTTLPRIQDDACVNEFKKVLGQTNFDYKHFLPAIDVHTDLATVKAPRHNDIIMGRPATVINLARVWSRREKGLFYMGNEAEKFRRAAATIPKKRIGDQWVEMPLFVDELSGKLVTVEGMAQLWRERAQTFLDLLGRGQIISDFLPVYDVGKSAEDGKATTTEKEVATKTNGTDPDAAAVAPGEEDNADKSEEKEQEPAEVQNNADTEKANDKPEEEETSKKPVESEEEDDSQWFTKKILIRDAEGNLRVPLPEKKKRAKRVAEEEDDTKEPEPEKKKRTKRPPEKDIIPDIVQGIQKARKVMKARARGDKTPAKRTAPEKRRAVIMKGKKGRPPGFNPYRESPYTKRVQLILTDISDIIGDAKKIIVQMEPDHSPERKHWKKQTARKSIVRPKPGTGSSSSSRDRDRSARSGQAQKRETRKKLEDEESKPGTRAQKKVENLDMVDGPPEKRTRLEKPADDKQEPTDKGAGNKPAKSNTKTAGSKNVQRRGSTTESGPATKKSKTESSSKTAHMSPRTATLSNKPLKPVSEPKPTKQAKSPKSVEKAVESAKKTQNKSKREETPEKKQRGRPPKKREENKKPTEKVESKDQTEEKRPVEHVSDKNDSNDMEVDTAGNALGGEDMDPEMPTLDLEITSQEYVVPADSPLPSTSSIISDDISRETKRAMQFLPADFDLEGAILETRKKSMKMVLFEEEAATVTMVGSASSPSKKQLEAAAGDAWDVLVGTPSKSPSKPS